MERKNKIMSGHKMCRSLIMVVCICLIALVNIDCRQSDRPRADKSTITLLYPIGSERDALRSRAPSPLVFLPLVVRNAAGELEGRLARRWEHSADYRTWTIHLRPEFSSRNF